MEEVNSSLPSVSVLDSVCKNPINEEYFDSYEDLEIHRLMLEDEPRITAYKDAILKNKEYFKDKIIMDVGCGTGILSIFCAQAGAKKVYAVEASNVAHLAKEIIKKNEFQNVIEVFNCKVEDLVLPGDIKVDAIVSEWMGFFLLHEGMLDSVIVARDKFLKPGGKMFPESAVLYIAPCSIPTLNQNWNNFEGINMSPFATQLRKAKQVNPDIMIIQKEDLLGEEEALCWVNLTEDKVTDLDSYSLQHCVGANKDGDFQGLCLWFECNFPNGEVLDTSPRSKPTHWKQTVIVLSTGTEVFDGEPLAYKLNMKRSSENPRLYEIVVEILDPESIDHPVPCSCNMMKCIIIKKFMASHQQHAIDNTIEQREIEGKRMSIGSNDELE